MTEETKQILQENMSSKWRQFKYDLKSKGFDESKTEEEMATNIPDTQVDPTQYRELVHHWCSKKGKDISKVYKRNRSKYQDIHCMGTKNLPRLIHEKIKAKGVQPSRAEIYIETRTRKDGTIVNEKAAIVIDELKKHITDAESLENSENILDSTNWESDIYSRVKGHEKSKNVRCMGKLPHHSSKSSNAEVKLKKLENLLGNLVSILHARFAGDKEINSALEAVAQEISNPSDDDYCQHARNRW